MSGRMPDAATDNQGRSFGLDLLRFLAVAGVVVSHCASVFGHLFGFHPPNAVVMAAFFGVELFFVLSGFLIGRLLLDIVERAPTARSFAIFMVRRWLRTLPPYYAWLATLPFLLPPPPALRLAQYATMMQNFAWPLPPGGFFSVSWSLAIEEWFYLLFSAMLIGAVALARARWPVWPVIAAFIMLPALARAFQGAPADYATSVYQVVLFRLDAIAWGVALAKLHRQGSRLFARPRLALALGSLLVALVWMEASTNFLPIGRIHYIAAHLFVTSAGLALCLVGVASLRRPRRWIAWPIAFGARISYAMYLTHLTILEVVLFYASLHGYEPGFVIAIALPLIVVLPWISFRFFEAPILALRPPQFAPLPPGRLRPAVAAEGG
jgi:peptidoglycan/LPS O-acetylase OafA/YrhL